MKKLILLLIILISGFTNAVSAAQAVVKFSFTTQPCPWEAQITNYTVFNNIYPDSGGSLNFRVPFEHVICPSSPSYVKAVCFHGTPGNHTWLSINPVFPSGTTSSNILTISCSANQNYRTCTCSGTRSN